MHAAWIILRNFIASVERDRKEPDKLLCHVQSAERQLRDNEVEPIVGLGAFIPILHDRMRLAFQTMDVDWNIIVREDGNVHVSVYHGPPADGRKRSLVHRHTWATSGLHPYNIEAPVRMLKRSVMRTGTRPEPVDLCTCPASVRAAGRHSVGCRLYEGAEA